MTENLDERIARLEAELTNARAERKQLQATATPIGLARQLSESRSYACDAADPGAVEHCAQSLSRYGFCVVDNVIPADTVAAIRDEVDAAEVTIAENMRRIRHARDPSLEPLPAPQLRPVRKANREAKPPNDIVWMPKYANHLAHPTTTGIARHVLDDHLRIAQLHLRPIAASNANGTPGGFGAVELRGRADTREWHTDWPHDLSAYGGDNPEYNVGCIRQPFPDVAMCLVMIWYLTDVDEDSAGTWVVPGSHRDRRNPRGPNDDMNVTAPIPGDLQVTAKAGSVFIQDSRTWHASAMHNTAHKRVAVVNRWVPWWVAVDDYAPGGWFDTLCRPLSLAEYEALPIALQPYLRHCCMEVPDTLQKPVLDRAAAAAERTRWGFEQLKARPHDVANDNAHIMVSIYDNQNKQRPG